MNASKIPVSTMSFPTRMLVGPGAITSLGREVRNLRCSRVLVVADHGVVRAGLAERVESILDDAGIARARYSGISKNPEEKDILDGVWAYTAFNAQMVVGVGGGASLDVAKGISLKVTHPLPLSDYDDSKGGSERITADLPPVIAVPTTAGTGSDVGRSFVVGLGPDHRKVVIFSPYLMPKVAICDAELTVSLPPAITAATGMDALTHALEAYVALGDHPFADTFALGALARIGNYLRLAVHQGNNLRARHEMMLAASMGAVAFQKGLGACHSLAHPLSAVCNLHHGLANSLMLPHVISYNLASATQAYAFAGQALGASAAGGVHLKADACYGAIRQLIQDIELPTRLRDVGVKQPQIDQMIPQVMADGCHGSNPRPLDEGAARALYREAY